ncbi:hypothetical protein GU243_06110 [Pseudarthrobacter psychrotolerans]|uniref:Uncharacterized protein n=1 Tax=Pseudarthrobacter psychrotolerans TaxID=2697569 RepID=A0A6P1NGH3_9MICC|nr:hypothetical protein [Pseudarthrobacter psychrotolerans]QHK19386.1 hypothetical protein GU243_06110 [Pseudarthrobacter psychrotolerans]
MIAPTYFSVIGTDHAPEIATDPTYEFAGHLAAAVAATSKDVETMKAAIWESVVTLAATGVDQKHIIGALSSTLAIFAVEIFNPAVDIMEELTPGLDYRDMIGRATGPEPTNTHRGDR